jgi:hypothetical protein
MLFYARAPLVRKARVDILALIENTKKSGIHSYEINGRKVFFVLGSLDKKG